MKKSLLLICTSLCILSFTIYNQIDFQKILQEKLEDYSNNHYPEKIYIQTDKPIYTLDEDIWFTGYLVNGITHQRTDKSRVLHVELINPKDSIVAQRTLYVNDISVAGDIKIDNNWEAGNYILRGYTNYMKNDKYESFFKKEIPIYTIQKDSITQKDSILEIENEIKSDTTLNLKPIVSFYPEGGYLINNLPNRVAFKVKNDKYKNISLKGFLKNQNGEEITEIKTLEFGLGNFMINPKPNNTYYLSILINGKEEKYPLPNALDKGYTLSVTNAGSSIIINAKSTLENGLQNTYLVVHERGTLLFKNYQETNKKSSSLKIPTTSLADGVVNFTLFNNEGNPVAERSVFVDNSKNNLKATINTNQQTYNSRKKVTLNLDVTNTSGTKEPSTLSMSVRDLKAFPYNTRTPNIKTYLLLTSDLRGKIEDPGYFFEKENDPKRRYILDLVMMTHGWKRFTWQELLSNKDKKQKFEPENSISISGVVKKLKKPYTENKGPVRLTFLGKIFSQEPTKISDSLGRFTFGPYGFMDTIPVLIEARVHNFVSDDYKERNVVILVDQPEASPEINHNTHSINNSNDLKKEANFLKVTQYIEQIKFEYNQKVEKLKAVELTAKRKTEESRRRAEMNRKSGYGGVGLGGSKRVDVGDLKGISSLTAYQLASRLSGVYVSNGKLYLTRTQAPAKIFLDRMEVDSDFIKSINAFEISFVDVLVGADVNLLGTSGGGAIALFSLSGNERSKAIKREPGVINFNAVGFYTARKFYAPDHINGFEEMNNNDVRTTLHWEPIIKTTNDKSSEITFFTSDLKSDYIIEVEGISANGQPIHAIKTFNVE